MKKKNVIRLLSLSLCGVLAATSITLFAKASTEETGAGEETSPVITTEQSVSLSEEQAGDALCKDEAVYVLANADGSVQKVIVNDWLADSLGEDSYRQKASEGELPVTVTISYFLDGRSVTAEELKGKSGHVVIRYSYQNNRGETAMIAGKEEKIYVPFAVLTGTLLDNNVFHNVTVNCGRLVNDGDRTIAAGIAFPGLQEDLGLSKDQLAIPDSFELEADVTNFEMESTFLLATNEIFNQIDLSGIDSMEELEAAADQLTSAMELLLDGSGSLTDGLNLLLEKSKDLSNGVDQLSSGSEALAAGAESLSGGASQLQGGTAQLSAGLNTLASNNASLNGGAKQVFDTLLATTRTQLVSAGISVPELTVENYGTVLNGVIASLDENAVYAQALQAVTDAVNAQADVIRQQVTAAVRTQIEQGVTEAITAQYGDALDPETLAGLIATTVDAKMSEETTLTMIESTTQAKIQELISANMASPEVQAKLTAASEGAKQIASLKASLDSYNSFYCGLQSYTAGVSQAASGASNLNSGAVTLKAGAEQLSSGAKEFDKGMKELKNSLPALLDGITKLRDGSEELKNGLARFDEEGIQKLSDAIDGDLEGFVERLQAILDASKGYRSYSDASDEAEGQVRFIYRIAEITK